MEIDQEIQLSKLKSVEPDVWLFVKKIMQQYEDPSHNMDHIQRVLETTEFLCQTLKFNELDTSLARLLAILHDVTDHKFKQRITSDDVQHFLQHDCQLSISIAVSLSNWIQYISFSKQCELEGLKHGNLKLEDDEYEQKRIIDVVRDSDRLDALGAKGIERCIQYVQKVGGVIPNDVIAHCKEKLLILYPEHYIVTAPAREIAKPLHDYIVNWVESNHIIDSLK